MEHKIQNGSMLLAVPEMEDSNFKHTVILICNYQPEGAFGFVINKPMELSIMELIDDFPSFDAPVFLGGPVENDLLHFLHCRPDLIDDGTEVSEGIFWGGDFEMLKMMVLAGQIKPEEVKFIAGYSGWEKNQLDSELESGSWITSDSKPEYIFGLPAQKIWSKIMMDKGGNYKLFSNLPENPDLN